MPKPRTGVRVPPALVLLSLALTGCVSTASFAAVDHSLEGSFTVLALPGEIEEMRGVVLSQGGEMTITPSVPPSFVASGLTAQGCRLVHQFSLTRIYLELETLGPCVAEAPEAGEASAPSDR